VTVSSRQVPAVIVSGYLGSGKTTLVGHLLRDAQARGVKLAIISNEFGDTGIDRALLEAGEEGFVELDGGCVCCRLSDALGETVEAILAAAQPDRLVLETSGVALPGDILVQFWRPPISDLVEDERVVVLVDAERFHSPLPLDETQLEQLEAADLVVLNKCDLVDEDALRQSEARLTELTAGRPVLRAIHGEVDPGLLYPGGETAERRDPDASPSPHSHEQFTSVELSFESIVDRAEVLEQVAAQQAVRAKGFVRTSRGVEVLQGVGTRIELTAADKEIPDDLVGRVVIIHRAEGSHLHHD